MMFQKKITLDGLNFAGSIPAEGTMNTKRNTQKEIVPIPNETRCPELEYIGYCVEEACTLEVIKTYSDGDFYTEWDEHKHKVSVIVEENLDTVETVFMMTCKYCGTSRLEESKQDYTFGRKSAQMFLDGEAGLHDCWTDEFTNPAELVDHLSKLGTHFPERKNFPLNLSKKKKKKLLKEYIAREGK